MLVSARACVHLRTSKGGEVREEEEKEEEEHQKKQRMVERRQTTGEIRKEEDKERKKRRKKEREKERMEGRKKEESVQHSDLSAGFQHSDSWDPCIKEEVLIYCFQQLTDRQVISDDGIARPQCLTMQSVLSGETLQGTSRLRDVAPGVGPT